MSLIPPVTGDYLERLEHHLGAYREDDDSEFIDNPVAYRWLTVGDQRAAVAEIKHLRAENAALLDGNQRLQTMNDGLRQKAIEAREAAEGWHQATIDLYSGRDEPHPADCGCGQRADSTGDPT
jgi:FtsZ-binding cell division protein ZapB